MFTFIYADIYNVSSNFFINGVSTKVITNESLFNIVKISIEYFLIESLVLHGYDVPYKSYFLILRTFTFIFESSRDYTSCFFMWRGRKCIINSVFYYIKKFYLMVVVKFLCEIKYKVFLLVHLFRFYFCFGLKLECYLHI